MAFDIASRNRLRNLVTIVRSILTEDVILQLQQNCGMDPYSGDVSDLSDLTHLNDKELETARLIREIMEHYLSNESSSGEAARKKAIERIAREQAFTVLNRLAALKMMESRDILVESVSKGIQSEGFSMYHSVAANSLGDTNETYRCFLFSLFDFFTTELPVLFDRNSPQSHLFPGDQTLAKVIDEINNPELESFWSEDETIGWIYQYFNSKEERKKMRDESSAPRNSRELAVRNQFFTPRYVVEFLTDNTLGRIWYEMTKGQTSLTHQCRYLVRRPNEIFLSKDAEAPEEETREGLSQEELLKQPVHIAHRPLKDPREILMLDPACGSMHFGLYCYDLFELIYEEAWDQAIPSPLAKDSSGKKLKPLQETYSSKEEYLNDVPRLILEFNLHGVDIDSRAVQIAGLSLWLRAQRSWKIQGIKQEQRPQIKRSNIVCAEPMPGEAIFLQEFIEKHLSANPEQDLIGQLLTKVFESMKLAGEAGTLLKIEEEIANSVSEAKSRWLAGPKYKQGLLFKGESGPTEQLELKLEVSGITDETFWNKAEDSIYAALQFYSESSEVSYQQRLFAEDSARGFAFIDVCRKRYDVVVMNPPFGEIVKSKKNWIAPEYKKLTKDLYCYFTSRAFGLITLSGLVGAITSASFKTYVDYISFRDLISKPGFISSFCDLGWGVLDEAYVEACCYTLDRSWTPSKLTPYFNLREITDKASKLFEEICSSDGGSIYWKSSREFSGLESSPIIYWWPKSRLQKFGKLKKLGELCDKIGKGAGPHAIFYRTRWEVPNTELGITKRWAPFSNGGNYSPFFRETPLVLEWNNSGALVKAYIGVKYPYLNGNTEWNIQLEDYFGRSGITYGKKTTNFSAQYLFSGEIFSFEGIGIFPSSDSDRNWIVSYLNSSFTNWFLNTTCGLHKNPPYLRKLPIPNLTKDEEIKLSQLANEGFLEQGYRCETDETSALFVQYKTNESSSNSSIINIINEIDQIINNNLELSEEDYVSGELENSESGSPSKSSIPSSILTPKTTPLSYLLGVIFGRWDIRYASGERQPPELPEHFDPLPVCPPGMLQNAFGLHAAPADVPDGYPIRISWPGILVDDPGHPEDILARIRNALEVIWMDRAEAIEQEACEILNVKNMRDYFYRPAAFFADHLKRYSKSRRKAPIYWPLSTYSGNYTIWIYYHRITDQTLFLAVNDFVGPKIEETRKTIQTLQGKADLNREDRGQLEEAQDLEAELQEFLEELIRLAPVWKPNLNDGVQITAAPLWELFQHKPWQKALKETWGKLEKGDYDWAHLAYSYWPERVKDKCRTDKSLAIAHGLEDLYES
jgi:hypothetical protein